MRTLTIVFLLIFAISILSAADYYSNGNNNINQLSSWKSNRDGSGTSPSSFGASNLILYVQNGHSMGASGTLDLTGAGSKLVIENGGTVTTGNYDHGILLDMQSNGTYIVTNTTYGTMEKGSWSNSSNFVINNASIQFEDGLSYGNLTIQSGVADVYGSSTFNVYGTLTVAGGTFEGGQSTSHTNNYGNIVVSSGYFYGCTAGANLIHNIEGDLTVTGGYFFATDGSGGATFYVGGNVNIGQYAWFYACYRSGSLDLPSTTWYISGDFVNNGYYHARNRAQGGYPTLNFTGINKSIKFGSYSSEVQGQHMLNITSGSSYKMTGNIHISQYFTFNINGTLDTDTYSVVRNSYTTGDPTCNIYGTVKTAHTGGLAAISNAAFVLLNINNLYLRTNCTVEYYSGSSQTVSPLSGYQYLILSGAGTKLLAGDATIAINIAMNAPLTISSGTMSLSGLMSGSSPISGGIVAVGGTAANLAMVPFSGTTFSLNRSNGCTLTGDLNVSNLYLLGGTLTLAYQTITVSNAMISGGAISGNSASTLNLIGTSAELNIPQFTIGTLTVNRANGCRMQANSTVLTNLNLVNGTMALNNYTLSLRGSVSQTNGTVNANPGTFSIDTGTTNVTLPFSSLSTANSVIMNRAGYVCYMANSIFINSLSINYGTFAIGSNSLVINSNLFVHSTNGVFSGGNSSNLELKASVNLPAMTLNTLTTNYPASTINFAGNVIVNTLSHNYGAIYLYNNSLTINQTLTGSYPIYGYAGSTIYLDGSSAAPMTIPTITCGNFHMQRNGTISLGNTMTITTSLRLVTGTITTNNLLSMYNGSTIYRSGGVLSGSVGSPSGHLYNVVYEVSCTTGSEIPNLADKLDKLTISEGLTVTADRNIDIYSELNLAANSVLDLDNYDLTLNPSAAINSGSGAKIWGYLEQDIADNGFNSSACGLVIASGETITDFAVSHQPVSQVFTLGVSIDRTWLLEGTFDNEQTVTFKWDSSADNGLDFNTYQAVVMLKSGSNWVIASDPVNAGGSDPRSITFQTSHFSEWTVTTIDQTLPVVLSSFNAYPTQNNYVMLNWITQSETNMLGFKLYRNSTSDLSEALDLNILIPATNTSNEQFYSYLDEEIFDSGTYYYWLQALELDGQFTISNAISVTVNIQPGTNDTPPPIDAEMLSIYPNPFNPQLFIRINHQQDGLLKVNVYDLTGRKVATLKNEYLNKGLINLTWNGRDDRGTLSSSGVYFIRCSSGKETKTIKAILLK